jgi:Calx-beta domain
MTSTPLAAAMLRALLALCVWSGIGPALAQQLPLLTISTFSWTEQNQFSTRMPVNLSLDVPATVEVRGFISVGQTAVAGVSPFALATPGPSCAAGVDFVEIVNRPFVIAVGARTPSVPIEVQICGDQVFEQNENFRVTVSAATLVGARCPNTSAGCGSVPTIVNDDSNVRGPVVRIDDVRIEEPQSGQAEAVLTLRLARTAIGDVTVGFRTQDDTAVSSLPDTVFDVPGNKCVGRVVPTGATVVRDYVPLQGSKVIPEGQVSTEIRVPICADGRTTAERDQRFFVVLTSASANTGGLADGRGEVTIVANGPPAVGTFQISPDRARVVVDQVQLFRVTWTLPEGRVWRDLNTIGLRIRDDERTALWLQWRELDDSFSLCRKADDSKPHGAARGGQDSDDELAALLSGVPRDGCGHGALAGSPTVLETGSARLHMASDDFGGVDGFVRATSLRVLRKDGTP